jgi:glyoxylase I family protein
MFAGVSDRVARRTAGAPLLSRDPTQQEDPPLSIPIQGLVPLLEVFDMPRSIAFYRDVLGFEVVSTSEPGDYFDWALLRLNEVELILNTAYERHERPAAPDPVRIAYGMRQVYVTDPDGFGLCFQWPDPG